MGRKWGGGKVAQDAGDQRKPKSHTILGYGFAAWKLPLCRQGALPPPEYFSRNNGRLENHQVVFVYDNFGGFFAQQRVDFWALLA